MQIVSPVSQLGRQKTRPVRGRHAVDAALTMLLRGTGLQVTMRSGNIISLKLAPKLIKAAAIVHPKRVPPPHALASEATPLAPAVPIIITGTRIARPELESAMPIAVVSMGNAKNFGYNTVYDALTRNPAIGTGLGISSSQGDTWDVGVANINLRNLGVNPTFCGAKHRALYPKPDGGAGYTHADATSVFARYRHTHQLFYGETKMPGPGEGTVDPVVFTKLVSAAVHTYGLEDRFILQSADWRTLDAMHEINPRIRTCLLYPWRRRALHQ